MLEEMLNQKVVVDMVSPYVCLGTLAGVSEHFLEVRNADLHDFRDTETTRENYIAASRHTGIKRNRKRVLVARDDVVAVSWRLGSAPGATIVLLAIAGFVVVTLTSGLARGWRGRRRAALPEPVPEIEPHEVVLDR